MKINVTNQQIRVLFLFFYKIERIPESFTKVPEIKRNLPSTTVTKIFRPTIYL